MKKMTAMLLALLCLSACGAPKQETTETAEQPEQTTVDTVQEQPKSEPVPVPEPEPEPESALPLDGKIICVDPGHEVTGEQRHQGGLCRRRRRQKPDRGTA